MKKKQIENGLGKGEEIVITGISENNIQKQVSISIYEDFPSTAFYKVNYKNIGNKNIIITKWVNNSYTIKSDNKNTPSFWSYQGASYEDRRDWVSPLTAGFEQENFMVINASDYGGGTPITDVWRKDIGFAIGSRNYSKTCQTTC